MKIVTFNVNGLRSIIEYYRDVKGWNIDQFLDSIGDKADIICLQETKISESGKLDHLLAFPKNYSAFYSFLRTKRKIGYSGVVTFCRKDSGWEPSDYEDGFSGIWNDNLIASNSKLLAQFSTEQLKELDGEGRCIVTAHGDFVLFNVYFPNDSGPERSEYRKNFYSSLWIRCQQIIEEGRGLLIVGDLNVAWHPKDHCEFEDGWTKMVTEIGEDQSELLLTTFLKDEPCTQYNAQYLAFLRQFYDNSMRAWCYKLLHFDEFAHKFNLADVFVTANPSRKKAFTCWNTKFSARGTNFGTRIDVMWMSNVNVQIEFCRILSDYMGSDHCPVLASFSGFEPPGPEIARITANNLKSLSSQRKLSDFFAKKAKDDGPIRSVLPSNATRKRSSKLSEFFPIIQIESSPVASEKETMSPPTPSKVAKIDEFKKLFTSNRPEAPKCKDHKETCIKLRVTKKGKNNGRYFYICSRGVGSGPESRCNHFEWMLGN